MASANFANTTLIAGGSNNISFTVNNQYYYSAGNSSGGQSCLTRTKTRNIDQYQEGIETDFLPWETYQVEQLLRNLNEQLNHRSVYSTASDHLDLTAMLDEILTVTIPFIYREFGFYRAASVYPLRRIEREMREEVHRMQGIIKTISAVLEARKMSPAFILWARLSKVWRCLWPWICSHDKISEAFSQLGECHKTVKANLFFIGQLCCGSRDPGRRVLLMQTEICDFFGKTWSLPQDLCSRREIFLQILAFKFEGGPAERIVVSRRFNVFRQDGGQAGLELVKNDNWLQTIEAGHTLQLSVVVGRQFQQAATVRGIQCPRCKSPRSILHQDGRWADCAQCDSSFNVTPSGLEETVDEITSPMACKFASPHNSHADEEFEESIFKIFSVWVNSEKGPQPYTRDPEPQVLSDATMFAAAEEEKGGEQAVEANETDEYGTGRHGTDHGAQLPPSATLARKFGSLLVGKGSDYGESSTNGPSPEKRDKPPLPELERVSTVGGSRRSVTDRLFARRERGDLTRKKGEDAKEDYVYKTGNDAEGDEYMHGHDKDIKPVFVKGLFSVATTSSKPPRVLRTDLRRVLDRMQVQYREIKTGFDCTHIPSVDISSVDSPSTRQQGQVSAEGKPSHAGDSPNTPWSPSLQIPTREVDKKVIETLRPNALSVGFEINIVKVPMLPLHGIQFRRVSGDGWQYQMLAGRVLTELKL